MTKRFIKSVTKLLEDKISNLKIYIFNDEMLLKEDFYCKKSLNRVIKSNTTKLNNYEKDLHELKKYSI